jgi:hypothetical protein
MKRVGGWVPWGVFRFLVVMLKLLHWALDRAASAPIKLLMTRNVCSCHNMSLGGLYIYLGESIRGQQPSAR